MPPAAEPDDPLADLVVRCIEVFEQDGEAAVDAELARHPALADAARAQLATLREAGLLVPPRVPERLGRYRVLQRLGTGGMGSVWLCEQDEPVRRRVAVKLIRPGMNQGDVLRRFHVERQTLALLEHPGIARMLDAGATDDGQPFFVMDHVPGAPITRYCDERQLDLRARIELFLRVCDAVQYAHQKGILHRDLKPSNVLVADRDGVPSPTVIDFGVAKSLGETSIGHTLLTGPGRLLGTPEYMSPEQATGDLDIDTRADVYSLGVMLFELLTGTLPIASARLRQAVDVARVLREVEPPTPSTLFVGSGLAADQADNRRGDARALRASLRGDLDWIVLKALEKDRDRRYGMVGEFAADLRRHLADEPVHAARPSFGYLLLKFCRRHRLQVAAAAAVAVAMTAGLVTSTLFYRDAAAAERDARALATRLHGSLDTTLAAVDRIVALGVEGLHTVPQSGPLRAQLLTQALELHERLLADGDSRDPRLAASLAFTQARAAQLHDLLGRPGPAAELLLRAERAIERCAAGGDVAAAVRLQLASASYLCGELRFETGELQASRVHTERALAVFDAVLAAEPSLVAARFGRLQALRALADRTTATDPEGARALLLQALPLAERFLGDEQATGEQVLASLRMCMRLGKLEAEVGHEAAARRLLGLCRERLRRESAAAAGSAERGEFGRLLTQLADAAMRLADWDNARDDARSAIAQLRPIVQAQPDNIDYRGRLATALYTLAMLQGDREPYAAVDAMQREAMQLESDCYEQAGRTAERGERLIGSLLGYVADRVDLVQERLPGHDAVDVPFLEQCLQRAETIRAMLPAELRRDRHVREAWTQYGLARAGLLQLAGQLAAARSVLAAGAAELAELLVDHPDVVQLHRIAASLAAQRARLEVRDGAALAGWPFVVQVQQAFAAALRGGAGVEAHWRRAAPVLSVIAREFGAVVAPAEIGADALAALAADCAACAGAMETRDANGAAVLLAFARAQLHEALARGLAAERAAAPEFARLR